MNEEARREDIEGLEKQRQEYIKNCIDQTLLVDAGAGAGKTTAMVNRIIQILRHKGSGVDDITNIAAITFTNKAADELKARIRSQCEQYDELDQQIHRIDLAQIGTIHSFAQNILRLYPVQARLPLEWTIIEEKYADQLFIPYKQRVLDLTAPYIIEQAHKFGDDEYFKLNTAFIEKLFDNFVVKGVATTRLVHLEHGSLGEAESDSFTEPARQVLGHVIDVIVTVLAESEKDRFRMGYLTFDDVLKCTYNLLRDNPDIRYECAKRWPVLMLDEFQDTDPLQLQIAMLITSAHVDSVDKVPEIIDDNFEDLPIAPGSLFVVGDAKQSIYRFRKADVAVFQSVQDYVKDLGLQGHGEVINLQANYRSHPLLVDFFNTLFSSVFTSLWQELDSKQEEIHEELEQLAQSKVFDQLRKALIDRLGQSTVGFTEQISLRDMGTRKALCAPGVDIVPIDPQADNFEASNMYNAVVHYIQRLIGDVSAQLSYDDICILVPSRPTIAAVTDKLREAGIPFQISVSMAAFEHPDVAAILRCCFAAIDPTDEVSVVEALRSTLIGCTDTQLFEYRQCGGDFDVSLRRPDKDVYATDVDSDNGVKDIEYSDISMDTSVADTHHIDNTFSEIKDVRRGLEVISSWARIVRSDGVTALVKAIIADGCVFERLSSNPVTDAYDIRQIREFLYQVDSFERETKPTPYAFLHWIKEIKDSDTHFDNAHSDDHDAQRVRVMTIHSSKGLEFKTVILAGVGERKMMLQDPVCEIEPGWQYCGHSDFNKALGSKEIVGVDKLLDKHERARLHYVACTRAEDRLAIFYKPTEYTKKKSESGMPLIDQRQSDQPFVLELDRFVGQLRDNTMKMEGVRVLQPHYSDVKPSVLQPKTVVNLPQENDLDKDIEFVKNASNSQFTCGVTQLVAAEMDQQTGSVDDGDNSNSMEDSHNQIDSEILLKRYSIAKTTGFDKDQPHVAIAHGAKFGTLVHRGIELLHEKIAATASEAVTTACQELGFEFDEAQMEQAMSHVTSVDSSQEFHNIIQGGKTYYEYPVILYENDMVVNGRIDLLVRKNNELIIVDFKTDAGRISDKHLEQYRRQLTRYQYACEQATGMKVVAKVLIQTHYDEPAERIDI